VSMIGHVLLRALTLVRRRPSAFGPGAICPVPHRHAVQSPCCPAVLDAGERTHDPMPRIASTPLCCTPKHHARAGSRLSVMYGLMAFLFFPSNLSCPGLGSDHMLYCRGPMRVLSEARAHTPRRRTHVFAAPPCPDSIDCLFRC